MIAMADEASSLPIDAVPDPFVRYEISDRSPEIAAVNEAFEAAFSPVATGTPVENWLRSDTAVNEGTVEELCSALRAGDTVDTELRAAGAVPGDAADYRLRTLDGERGLLLTELATGVAVDRIASIVSHDLRNPLDVANAHLRAARETGAEEHFDQIRASHERMERIIQDVLTLSQREGAIELTDNVGVADVAADAWATVDTAGASLTLAADLPTIAADPDRLQRLFENLFRNAVEHSPANRTHDAPTQVRVGRVDGGFFVADDGVGIPEAERDRVFAPGYTTDRSGGGTGLGLTIVERIAEAHGWTISLTASDAGGARFEVRPAEG
jgi:signal transduction histidine kinase